MKITQNSATQLSFKLSLSLALILSMSGDVISLGISPLFESLLHIDEKNSGWLALAVALVPAIFFCLYLRNHFPDSFKIKDRKFEKHYLWIAFGVIVGIIFYNAFLFSKQFWTDADRIALQNNAHAFRNELQHLSVLPSLAMLMAFHVLVPIMEEFVFRGLLFFSIAQRTNSVAAYVASSFLFGCIHPSFHITTFVFGLCACSLVHMSGRLTPAIAMHMIYNSLVTWTALS